MEPEDTSTTSLPDLASAATSSISEFSQSVLSVPVARSARSAEPIFTTIRLARSHSGRTPDADVLFVMLEDETDDMRDETKG
jgi:hypothetical protein